MGTPSVQLRVSEECNDQLKKVAAMFPEWCLAQLAQKLLVESCKAILTEDAIGLPTVDYLRAQIGRRFTVAAASTVAAAAVVNPLLNEMARLRETLERQTPHVDSPPGKTLAG